VRREELVCLSPWVGWPHAFDFSNRVETIQILANANHRMKMWGLNAHWAYSVPIHAEVIRLYNRECKEFGLLGEEKE